MRDLEKKLNYTFRNQALLEEALNHSSYANEHRAGGLRSNERLEFLGDSVLGFVTAEFLFCQHPDLPEGDLTRIRAALVCEQSLYEVAQKLGLELVVDDMDFDSALSAVQTGKSDIVAAGVTVTPERQNTMCFTDSYALMISKASRSAPSAAPPVIAIASMITARTAWFPLMTAPPPCRTCSPVRSTAS